MGCLEVPLGIVLVVWVGRRRRRASDAELCMESGRNDCTCKGPLFPSPLWIFDGSQNELPGLKVAGTVFSQLWGPKGLAPGD